MPTIPFGSGWLDAIAIGLACRVIIWMLDRAGECVGVRIPWPILHMRVWFTFGYDGSADSSLADEITV